MTIQDLYQYFKNQIQSGTIRMEYGTKYRFEPLLDLLSVSQVTLTAPSLRAADLSGVLRAEGTFTGKNRVYLCELSAFLEDNAFTYLFLAKLKADGPVPLDGLYPPADMRICWNFHSKPVNLFNETYVTESAILADTREELPRIRMNVFYTADCLLFKLYRCLVPDANQTVLFQGTVTDPFNAAVCLMEANFPKNIELPFAHGSVRASSSALCLTKDRVLLKLRLPIGELRGGEPEFLIDLCETGSSLFPAALLEDMDVTGDEAESLIESVTGHSIHALLPDWLDTDSWLLQKVILHMEKNIYDRSLLKTMRSSVRVPSDEGTFLGCAFHFAVNLRSFPIPFFDREKGDGAQIRLVVQYDMLDTGAAQRLAIAFYGTFKGYRLLLNIYLPELAFEGRLDKKAVASTDGALLFQGLEGLAVQNIVLYGNIPPQSYGMEFAVKSDRLPELDIGKKNFSIDAICGGASYSHTGLAFGVELSFTLFKGLSCLLGGDYKYDRGTGKQTLFLEGGLGKEFQLASLISLISGNPVSEQGLDFVVKSLHLSYRTVFPAASGNSLGDPQEFTFFCNIAFDWGTGELGTVFQMHWIPDLYTYSMTAYLEVLDFLRMSAGCTVTFLQGTPSFQNFAFQARIGKTDITATYDKDKNYSFRVQNFNFGELLEELICLINDEHDWYLPWPFSILKDIRIDDLEVILDNKNEILRARYYINFKLLFLTVRYIELYYDKKQEDFLVNIQIGGSLSAAEDGEDILALNLLKDIFPVLKKLGEKQLHISYLGIGQHIAVSLPSSFDGEHLDEIFKSVKNAITKEGVPVLNPDNNWLAALKFKLLKAIDITLLMCDPIFYGAEISIGKGFEMTDQLDGLSFTVLYSKVTETVGMFYARLTFPELWRTLRLGPATLMLGEIAVSVYTNGNFKLDLGFPYNKDFSRSFGISYMEFTGRGGFYFGILNGDTSLQVPAISRGHFETVVELGIGLEAGIGLEISAGPLKAGAYVKMIAIFEGLFASYVSEEGENTTYYKVKATAGITAALYGSVDFILIQIGFSVNAALTADLLLERYKKTELALELYISVHAYIKILFIKIQFDFQFHWSHTFLLGSESTPPWGYNALPGNLQEPGCELRWSDEPVFSDVQALSAEIVPQFSYDNPVPGQEHSGEGRAAFVALLHGFDEGTRNLLRYEKVTDSPFSILVQGVILRLLHSVYLDGEPLKAADLKTLKALGEKLKRAEVFREGFSPESLNSFLCNNLTVTYRKGSADRDGEIQGIPFPLTPDLKLTWFTAPDSEHSYELDKEPVTGQDFMARLQEYYAQLAVETPPDILRLLRDEKPETAGTFLLTQYFYMLTRIVLSVAVEHFPENRESLSPKELGDLVSQESVLKSISGMICRFQFGGSRVVTGQDGHRESLHTYAFQQFAALSPKSGDCGEEALIHKLTMELQPDAAAWARLTDSREESSSLVWELQQSDLNYPAGALNSCRPTLLPYYRTQDEFIELKNANAVSGTTPAVFLETREPLSAEYRVVIRGGEQTREAGHQKGILLYIPITKAGECLYSVGSLGYQGLNILKVLKTVRNLELYRVTTPLDEERTGYSSVTGKICLYRTNLCLEAEKPELARLAADGGYQDSGYRNSAWLSDGILFLELLRDASLVNSRGYYIYADTEADAAIPDGCETLVLWAETDEHAQAVKLTSAYEPEKEKPVVMTGRTYGIPAYEPGTLAFTVDAPKDSCEIQNTFQMLMYCTKENSYFSQSHESMPIFPQYDGNKNVYSQIIPAFRLAKGGNGGPYSGVGDGSTLAVGFSWVDILGNKSLDMAELQTGFGYTDFLLSPVTWPHTRCVYRVVEEDGAYAFILTFSYVQEAEAAPREGDRELIASAYWQMMCPDIQIHAALWEDPYPLDAAPLKTYIETLYQGGRPADVSYRIAGKTVLTGEKKIALSFHIARDRRLIAPSLAGSPEAERILSAAAELKEDNSAIDCFYLARCGSDSSLFLSAYPDAELSEPDFLTLLPLWNHLVNLPRAEVWNLDGSTAYADYYGIDMERWADTFLSDFEELLHTDLPHTCRDTFEKLLQIKNTLAEKASADVCTLNGKESPYRARAAEFYKNEMLKNLRTGRSYDGVIVAKSSVRPEAGRAYLFSMKTQNADLTLKAGKIREDGFGEFGIKAKDIRTTGKTLLHAEYSITDTEISADGYYDYLTFQKTAPRESIFDLRLPYKRFPDVPRLHLQDYKASGNLFFWSYRLRFSHETAAQDTVRVRLLLDQKPQHRATGWQLPAALARYMYLRETLLHPGQKDSAYEEMLLKICGAIGDAWSCRPQENRLTSANEIQISFYRDMEKHALVLEECSIGENRLHISVKSENETFAELVREGSMYLLPNQYAQNPMEYEFTVDGFDIREENRINAALSVNRNHLLRDIDPRFLYETAETSFPEALLPIVKAEDVIRMGTFERKNFVDRLSGLLEHVKKACLEINCAIALSHLGESPLYSHVPVSFVPTLPLERTEDFLQNLYTDTKEFLEENLENPPNGSLILISLSIADISCPGRNLAELEKLGFTIV